jgi:hypothetical protein
LKLFASHIIAGVTAAEKVPAALADKDVPDWTNYEPKLGPKKWEPVKWVTGGAPQSKWGKNQAVAPSYPKYGVTMSPPRWPPPPDQRAKEPIKL